MFCKLCALWVVPTHEIVASEQGFAVIYRCPRCQALLKEAA